MKITQPKSVPESNQQGQQLGRKGLQTKQKLMAAALELLNAYSPVDLTAVAIAKEAGTSSASFYMYFVDVSDILYALAEQAGLAMSPLNEIVKKPWDKERLRENATLLVETFNVIWNKHRVVLRFRNLEADRGDPRFESLRLNTYVPFIDLLARQIIACTPENCAKPSLGQAFSLASVLHAAMERLASTEPAVVARGVGTHRLTNALVHTIMLVFSSGAPQSAENPALQKEVKPSK